MNAKELLPLIDPERGPQYSPNLHAWIRKQYHRQALGEFEKDAPTIVTTKDENGLIRIGHRYHDGWLSMSNLASVLSTGSKVPTYGVPPHRHAIDECFWDRYIRDGRCAIDTDHTISFIDEQTRWKENADGSHRECLWCGHHVQVKLQWTEEIIHADWVPA